MKFSSLLEIGVEVEIAKLGDDVHVVGGLEDIEEFDYIFVADSLHDIDFRVQVFEVEIVGEDSLVDHFYCNRFSCFYDFAAID
mgnify:CR=1 FL=1